jgi:hypothetical protein
MGRIGEGERQPDVAYMRIDFSDLPGEPISETDARKVTDQVEKFYSENSFGKLKLKTTITPVLRVPEPFATYLTKELAIDARAVAKSKG